MLLKVLEWITVIAVMIIFIGLGALAVQGVMHAFGW